jgi:nucleoside phosphorylase
MVPHEGCRVKLLFIASDPMEFRGLLAHATAVREAEVTARWSRLATLGADEVLLVANGAGPDRAAAATDAGIKAFDAAAIVSTGFCGALSPDLAIADLVTATSIEAADRTYSTQMCNNGPRNPMKNSMPEVGHAGAALVTPAVYAAGSLDVGPRQSSSQGLPSVVAQDDGLSTLSPARSDAARSPRPGAIRSIPYIAQTAAEKRNLAVNGAIAVEMEAAGIAARAESHGLPLYCIRAVTDLAGENLANDFNKALRLDGQFDTILILKGSLLHPLVRLPELFRLRKRCVRAAHVLGDFFAYSRI